MENQDTRYIIEIDLKTRKIIDLRCEQKQKIDVIESPESHKTFVITGQCYKLLKRVSE